MSRCDLEFGTMRCGHNPGHTGQHETDDAIMYRHLAEAAKKVQAENIDLRARLDRCVGAMAAMMSKYIHADLSPSEHKRFMDAADAVAKALIATEPAPEATKKEDRNG